MSKIGNLPIEIPATVEVKTSQGSISIKSKEAELQFAVPKALQFKHEADKLVVVAKNDKKKTRSVHGLFRQLIFNAVKGVETPWQKKLEVVGTGYNVRLQGQDLVLKIGFSHPVIFKKQPAIKFQVEGNNKIAIMGADKQLVGQVAYQIKMLKKPDAYKGKGIRYEGEVIKLKPGKKVKTITAAA